MLTTPQDYLDSLSTPGKEWLAEFLEHMNQSHPDITPIMFRQRPMFKIGQSYVFFTVAKEHFAVHTLNFDLIENLKAELPKADYGKGCVKVKFKNTEAKSLLKALCDQIIHLNRLPDAPPVDVTPELPYEIKLSNAFSASKAKWLPLYKDLQNQAKSSLPEFIEYFPAVNILWKHTSSFAQVSAVTGAMRIEFFADKLHPERNPVKTQQLSKNRVSHTVEVTDNSGFDDILQWIAESYQLTAKK